MRVSKYSLKKGEGEISLLPENLDDLWHFKYLIEEGDTVYALTKRKADASSDKLRPEKREKRTVRLGVMVEAVEFHTFANRLRIKGTITSEEDSGSYHTLNIEPMRNISIIKKWRKDQIERINRAVKESKTPKVILCTIEIGEAVLGEVFQFGVREYSNIKSSSGKGYGGKSSLFEECYAQLNQLLTSTGAKHVVLAGPGFIKEDFHRYIKDRSFKASIIVEDTSSIGVSGFYELISKGALARAVESMRLSLEATLMNELLKEISVGKLAVYGLKETKESIEMGAVRSLMIADEFLRENRDKEDFEALILKVEQQRGEHVILSSEFDPGRQLMSLGGIAGLLRFRTGG